METVTGETCIPAQRGSRVQLRLDLTVEQYQDLMAWAEEHDEPLDDLALRALLEEAHR